MTIAFVRGDAFAGNFQYNPFYFGTNFNSKKGQDDFFHIKKIDVTIQGGEMQVMKDEEMSPYDMMAEYVRFQRVFSGEGYNECNNISYSRFKVSLFLLYMCLFLYNALSPFRTAFFCQPGTSPPARQTWKPNCL